MNKQTILDYLASVKPKYVEEGFIIQGLFGSYSRGEETASSDIDVLVEAEPAFANKYGFKAIERIHQIELEMGKVLGVAVDIADRTGMGRTAKTFILDRTIYV